MRVRMGWCLECCKARAALASEQSPFGGRPRRPPSVTFLTVHLLLPPDLCTIKPIHMKPNMGSTDRLIRVTLAIAIAVLYFTGVLQGTLGIVLLVLAVVFVGTSFISFCPLYLPFGIRTNKDR